jgi:hypothetical protein
VPENSGGYVYGTILVATLLAAESPGRETYGETAGAVAVALVIYWLAIAYAEYVGHRAGDGEHFEVGGLAAAARHELPVMVGAVGPLVALLACRVAGASLHLGVTVAVWAAVGIIIVTELVLGIRSRLDGVDLVVQTGFGMVVGIAVIGLRLLLH